MFVQGEDDGIIDHRGWVNDDRSNDSTTGIDHHGRAGNDGCDDRGDV
jgi:hypothetical protein